MAHSKKSSLIDQLEEYMIPVAYQESFVRDSEPSESENFSQIFRDFVGQLNQVFEKLDYAPLEPNQDFGSLFDKLQGYTQAVVNSAVELETKLQGSKESFEEEIQKSKQKINQLEKVVSDQRQKILNLESQIQKNSDLNSALQNQQNFQKKLNFGFNHLLRQTSKVLVDYNPHCNLLECAKGLIATEVSDYGPLLMRKQMTLFEELQEIILCKESLKVIPSSEYNALQELSKTQKQQASYSQELQSLRKENSYLKEQLKEKQVLEIQIEKFEQQVKELEEEHERNLVDQKKLKDWEKEVNFIRQNLTALQQDSDKTIDLKEAKNQSQSKIKYLLLRALSVRTTLVFRFKTKEAFKRWKKDQQPEPSFASNSRVNTSVGSLKTAVSFDPSRIISTKKLKEKLDYYSAKEVVASEKPDRNMSLERYRHQTTGQVFTTTQLLEFFRDLMESKYFKDLEDLRAGNKPCEFPNYFLNYTTLKFPEKGSCTRFTADLIQTLNTLTRQNNPLGTLICRLLQIYDSEPVPFLLSLFIVKLWDQVKHYVNFQDQTQDGGTIGLVDLIPIIETQFQTDPKSGRLLMKMLKKQSMKVSKYIGLRISHKLTKLNQNKGEFFEMLDTENSGTISEAQYKFAVKNYLQLLVTSAEVSQAYLELDPAKRGLLRQVFLSSLDCHPYNLTVSELFSSIASVFQSKQTLEIAMLAQFIQKKGELTRQKIYQILEWLVPGLEHTHYETIYKEAVSLSNFATGVSQYALLRAAVRLGVLPLGPFSVADTSTVVSWFESKQPSSFGLLRHH